jgi:hypothetical protein
LAASLRFDMKEKRNVSSSFNADWTCNQCSAHGNKPCFKTRGEAGTSCGDQAVILSDQCFPPILPATGSGKCFKILRVENGSIHVLVAEFTKALGNRIFPPGSIILMSSFAHLGRVGLTAYINDLLWAESELKSKLGRDTIVRPLPPLLLPGCEDKTLIRDIYDLADWMKIYYKNDRYHLHSSHAAAMAAMSALPDGVQSDLATIRYRLPVRSGPGEAVSAIHWTSRPRVIPAVIKQLGYSREKELVSTMIAELRESMALDLDSNPSFERGLVLQVKVKTNVDYLIIGGSNAARLARALDGLGFSTCSVTKPGWKISSGSPELLAKMTKTAIEGQEPGTTILQILDNSIFYAKSADGSWTLPAQDDKGAYHIKGEVRVANRETQMEHYNALKPLFEVLEKRTTYLLTPLPRYVTNGCCSDPDHTINRADPEYKPKMMKDLDTLKRNYKDFIFRDGRRSMKILDPNVDLRGMEDDDIWGPDPVHPKNNVYQKIAEGIVKMAGELSGKRRRTDSLEGQQPGPSRGRGRGHNPGVRGAARQQPSWTHIDGGDRGGPMRDAARGYGGGPRRPRGGHSNKRGRGYYF